MNGDQLITDAGKNLMNADPVLGSLCVLLVVTVIGCVLWIKAILKEKDARTDNHLADVRKYAAETEASRAAIAANTEQLRVQSQTMATFIEVFRDRERVRS